MENVPVSINNLEKAQWSHEHFILSYRKKKKKNKRGFRRKRHYIAKANGLAKNLIKGTVS